MSATVGYLQSYADKTKWQPSSEAKEATRKTLTNSEWADGLRGIAAVYVMLSHMTLAFARYIVAPNTGMNQPSYWMQRPILRLVGQGPAWVACFIILSGFVNSLRPIKLARQGQVETALSNLAVSSFRRSFRLFLPALTATVGSWFICQLGAYKIARESDAYWLAVTSPQPSASIGIAIDDLIRAVRSTWMFDPQNDYDQPQWALLYLLLGSMICFTSLLVLINMRTRFRVGALAILWLWSWNWDIKLRSREFPPISLIALVKYGHPANVRILLLTAMVAMGIYTGILLAELHHSDIPLRLARFSPIYTPPLLLLSLILMSFPAEYQKQAPWSSYLLDLHMKCFGPLVVEDRAWPAVGSGLLCFTIVMSPHMRKLLSQRYLLWLGKISFPLYLLHGSFMRSILAWLLFANQSKVEIEQKNGEQTYVVMKYPLPPPITYVIVMPIFFGILGYATHLWANKVEPHFGAITKNAETIMFGKKDVARQTPLPVARQD